MPAPLNVFFDVDFTLISTDGHIRPGTHATFEQLVSDGHRLYVWSGVGYRNEDIERHQLDHLVTDFFIKPQEDFEAGLQRFGVHVRPDFVVDDDIRIVSQFGGMLVEPYYFPSSADEEMQLVYDLVSGFAEAGHLEHPAFRIARALRTPSDTSSLAGPGHQHERTAEEDTNGH